MDESIRELVRAAINEAVVKFMYYDRKEDEDLPLEVFRNALATGAITKRDLVDWFTKELTEEDIR